MLRCTRWPAGRLFKSDLKSRVCPGSGGVTWLKCFFFMEMVNFFYFFYFWTWWPLMLAKTWIPIRQNSVQTTHNQQSPAVCVFSVVQTDKEKMKQITATKDKECFCWHCWRPVYVDVYNDKALPSEPPYHNVGLTEPLPIPTPRLTWPRCCCSRGLNFFFFFDHTSPPPFSSAALRLLMHGFRCPLCVQCYAMQPAWAAPETTRWQQQQQQQELHMLIFFSFFSSFFSFLSSTAIIILPSPSELFSVNHSALFLLLKKKKKKKNLYRSLVSSWPD